MLSSILGGDSVFGSRGGKRTPLPEQTKDRDEEILKVQCQIKPKGSTWVKNESATRPL